MLEQILQGTAYATVFASLAVVLAAYPRLPRRIAVKFSLRGNPRHYGSRLMLALGPACVLAVMPYLSWAAAGHRTGEAAFRGSPELLFLLLTEIGVLLTVINRSIVAIATGKSERLAVWPLNVGLVAIVSTVAISIVTR